MQNLVERVMQRNHVMVQMMHQILGALAGVDEAGGGRGHRHAHPPYPPPDRHFDGGILYFDDPGMVQDGQDGDGDADAEPYDTDAEDQGLDIGAGDGEDDDDDHDDDHDHDHDHDLEEGDDGAPSMSSSWESSRSAESGAEAGAEVLGLDDALTAAFVPSALSMDREVRLRDLFTAAHRDLRELRECGDGSRATRVAHLRRHVRCLRMLARAPYDATVSDNAVPYVLALLEEFPGTPSVRLDGGDVVARLALRDTDYSAEAPHARFHATRCTPDQAIALVQALCVQGPGGPPCPGGLLRALLFLTYLTPGAFFHRGLQSVVDAWDDHFRQCKDVVAYCLLRELRTRGAVVLHNPALPLQLLTRLYEVGDVAETVEVCLVLKLCVRWARICGDMFPESLAHAYTPADLRALASLVTQTPEDEDAVVCGRRARRLSFLVHSALSRAASPLSTAATASAFSEASAVASASGP
jgi:hypothetical protein